MPHVPFTLAQHATIQAFPASHRLALRARIVLDPEEAEEIAELYARDPHDVAYVLAATEDGAVELTKWPSAEWRLFETVDAALHWVIDVEEQLELESLRTPGSPPAAVALLPVRLHRAIRVISMSGDPEASDAQAAVGQASGRIVQLEEALHRVLDDEPGARENARLVLVQGGWWRPPE